MSSMLITLLSILSPAPPQDAACNNVSRESDIVAGDHNFTNQTCQELVFRVLGQEYRTPAECTRGGAHYGGTVFKCVGQLPGWHCNPRGWEVDVTTYTEGACPSLPQLDVATWEWDSWAKVPKALKDSMECKPPKKKEEKDRSATHTQCDTDEAVQDSLEQGQVYTSASGAPYVAWEGNPLPLDPESEPWSLFLTDYDLAQTASASDLGGVLAAVGFAHSTPPGFFVHADVTLEHFDGPGDIPSNTYAVSVRGDVASSGRFDLVKVVATLDDNGIPDTVVHRCTFDGHFLRDAVEGAARGNAYARTFGNRLLAKATYAATIEPLFWWAHDPFELPLFEDMTMDEEATEPGIVRAMRSFGPPESSFVGEEYVVDVSGGIPRPVQYAVLDSSGACWRRVTYADYFLCAESVWRPLTVRVTHFLNGTPDGPRIVTTTRLLRASVLTADQALAVPTPFPETQDWQVWL